MYLNHYKIKAKPFQISCDPRFLWMGEKHKEALAMLHYGIMENRGFLLLTGEVGTGKTILINRLVTHLPANTVVTTLPDPDLTPMDFFHLIADGFRISSAFKTKGEFIINLRKFLYHQANRHKRVLLFIDEAQRLNKRLIEEIRVLSNIEYYDRKLINIFFAGQQEFNKTLMQPQHRALAQRITIRFHLEPLSLAETDKYIRHRLKVAGNPNPLFMPDSIEKVFEYSAGIPRLINIICDHALLTGYVQNKSRINADIINECADELRIPTQFKGVTTIRHTNKPTRSIGIPSTLLSEALKINKAATGSRLLPDNVKEKRLPNLPPVRVHYASAAAVILAICGLLLMVYDEPPSQVQSQSAMMYRNHIAVPQAAYPLYVIHLRQKRISDSSSGHKEAAVKKTSTKQPMTEFAKPAPSKVSNRAPMPPAPKMGSMSIAAIRALQSSKSEHKKVAVKKTSTKRQGTSLPRFAPSKVSNRKPLSQAQKTAPMSKGAIPTPKKRKIIIDFNQANHIASQSLPAINQVATYLLKYPERIIYIQNYGIGAGSSEKQRKTSRGRIAAIKNNLIGRGAYPSQIKVMPMGIPAMNNPAGKRIAYQAVIEFPARPIFSEYNPDK